MDSLTFNKFAAGILVALLLVTGIGKLGSILYGPQEVAHDEGVSVRTAGFMVGVQRVVEALELRGYVPDGGAYNEAE